MGDVQSSLKLCPKCNGQLFEVPRHSKWLNDDQWQASKAGDWYCVSCPDNGRGNSGFCYFTDAEIRGSINKENTMNEQFLKHVRQLVGRLHQLLEDPQPGSMSWCWTYGHLMNQLSDLWLNGWDEAKFEEVKGDGNDRRTDASL